MGGFDVGGLYGALTLDDAQFTEAVTRAGGTTALFKLNVDKLKGSLTDIIGTLQKSGYDVGALATKLNMAMVAGVSDADNLSAAWSEFGAALALVQQRAMSLAGAQKTAAQQKLDIDRDAISRQKEIYGQDILNVEGSIRIHQEEASARIALANKIAVAEANLLAEQVAADKAAVASRILRYNQEAQGAVMAAAIEKEASVNPGSFGLRLSGSGVSPRGFIGASSPLLAGAAAAFGVYEIVSMTKAVADAARETQNLADKLDLSWQAAKQLEQVSTLSGISIGGLSASAFHLSEALDDAGGRGAKTVKALSELGVTGSSVGELLQNTLTAISEIGDASKRMDVLHDVFQKQSQELVPLVNNMSKYRDILGGLGVSLDNEMVAKLKETALQMSIMGLEWDKLKANLATGIVGTVIIKTLKFVSGGGANPSAASVLGVPEESENKDEDFIEMKASAFAQRIAAVGDNALVKAAARAREWAAQHQNNIELLKTQLADTQASIKTLNAELGSPINPIQDDKVFDTKNNQVTELLQKEIELKKKIKALNTDPDTLAAKGVRQDAQLEEAQTALNKFAEAYNNSFQLLTGEQQAFIESSFIGLNGILGKGVKTANLSTFKAELGKYSEALKVFTGEAKAALEQEKLSEALDKMSVKFSEAEGQMSSAEFAYLNALFGRIDQMVKAGVDPRIIQPLMTEFNDKLSESAQIGKSLASEAQVFGREYEKSFKMADTGMQKFIEGFNRLSTEQRLVLQGSTEMADKVADDFRQAQLRRILGIRDPNTVTQTQNATMDYLGTNAQMHDKMLAVTKMFEDMAAASGLSAEVISQQQKFMIDGVVADYDTLKDRLKSSLSVVQQGWTDLMHDFASIAMNTIGKLGGAVFDTLFPDFTNPKNNDPLKPLVDSFRSAFEQLSSYSDPKGALNNLVRSIQQAGSASQANAIAVKYFGTTAGPLLAAELRNGTISAKDLKTAIDAASASTLDYANKTTDSVSQLTLLWRQLVKDIVVSIIERLIGIGLISLLTWLGIVGKGTNTLASAMDQVFTKLALKLGILFKKLASDITLTVKATVKAVEDIINGMYATATVVIRTVYETIGSPGNGGYGGDDPGSLFTNMLGGGGFGGYGGGGFDIPDWYTNMVNSSRGYGGGEGGGEGGGYNGFPMPSSSELSIGHITVVSNDPREFVRKLKSLRAV